jgi:molecular chaperone GrpE
MNGEQPKAEAKNGAKPEEKKPDKQQQAEPVVNKDEKRDVDQDMKEQLMRLAAEFDNYKKRTRKDVDNAKNVGMAEIMKDLLPVVDEFYMASVAAQKSQDKPLAKGIEMLYSNFISALKKRGLKEIHSKGTFDPYVHEIIMTREEEGKKAGTILEVTKPGYMMNEILLRPVSVIIAAEKSDEKKSA